MTTVNTCSTWLRIAVLYFVAAALLGILMGIVGDHTLFPVHAHLNLLGWVSMAIFGLIYRQYPELGASKLAKTHFWLYNISLPFTMITLACLLKGNAALEPVVGIGSLLLGVAIVLFALNIMLNLPRN